MLFFQVMIFLCALFAGTLFSTFVLTALEAKFIGFQNFLGRVHNLLPKTFWTVLTVTALGGFSLLFLFVLHVDYVRAAIFAGICSGFVVAFRHGPNIDRKDMEKAAKAFEQEQREKRQKHDKKRRDYVNGGKKGSKGNAKASGSRSGGSKSGSSGRGNTQDFEKRPIRGGGPRLGPH